MSTTIREHVTATYGTLRKGDRFADGWVVKRVAVKPKDDTAGSPDWAHVYVGKAGRKGTFYMGKPAADAVTVARRASTAGQYVRRSAVNRETGTLIEVVDMAHPDSEFPVETDPVYDAKGNEVGRVTRCRYATICADHSTIVTHETLALALSHAAVPTGWCERCAGTDPEDDDA